MDESAQLWLIGPLESRKRDALAQAIDKYASPKAVKLHQDAEGRFVALCSFAAPCRKVAAGLSKALGHAIPMAEGRLDVDDLDGDRATGTLMTFTVHPDGDIVPMREKRASTDDVYDLDDAVHELLLEAAGVKGPLAPV